MKKALLILLILFTGNVMASSLPNCSPYISSIKWNNCFGTFTWDDGDKYVGEYKDGKKNGQGTYTWANGNKYVGEWNGEKEGQGTLTWANGDKYVGEWINGEKKGQGTFTWANGDKHVGEFKDNVRNGRGTFTYANGEKYIGEWKDDKRYGLSRKDVIEIFVTLFLLIFFGVCLYQFFGINIPSIALLIILYPFKQLALLIRYFFSLTLVKIFMKTLLIFTPLVLIYLVIYNIEIVLPVLLIISLFFFVIWLSGDGIQ